MRKFCLGICAIGFSIGLSAQKISNKVMPSVGGSLSSGTHQISFTIGETLISTLSTSGSMLTQGFQQPINGSSLSLQNPGALESLVAFVDNGTAKLVLGTKPTAKSGNFVLERLNMETGTYEAVDSRPFNVTKTEFTKFDFTDTDPLDGENVYRVKQVVEKEVPRLSDVRKLNFDAIDMVSMYPNPTIDEVNLDLSAYMGRKADISIISISGQSMLQQKVEKIGSQPIKILVNSIETGQYQIRVNVSDKKNPIIKSLMISK
jgi:Secretion system C-terminal sorting domain